MSSEIIQLAYAKNKVRLNLKAGKLTLPNAALTEHLEFSANLDGHFII
jgi:hypothetical protein